MDDGGHGSDRCIVPVQSEADLVRARHNAREMALRIGFSSSEVAVVSLAISELARNILQYAKRGEIILKAANSSERPAITIIARDEGPGIGNLDQAMKDGYSTSGGLGLGLPGVRRLMDEFQIASVLGQGTTVTAKKCKG